MKKNNMSYGLTVLGVILLGGGLFLIKTLIEPQGIMRGLPYICVGLGCGILARVSEILLAEKPFRTVLI